ncbi:MAG: TIGR02186 family protein [Rhodobacteraceae bacterium]|nr:TIGR02186 family protein [Paracoccaceae bacterium]
MLRLVLMLILLVLPAQAEEVVADLSQDRVAITTNFDGSEILIFGAVKREQAVDDTAPLDVIVTVSGPSEPMTVRRKDRVAGIWVNTAAVEVDAAPSFYAVATTGPLTDILSETEDLRHHISINRAIRAVGAPEDVTDSPNFIQALIDIKLEDETYQTLEGAVELTDETLFSTRVALPANLREGEYATRFFLIRDGDVVDNSETTIFVQKVGLERLLYNLAHQQPLMYGLLSLFIAIAAGWTASAVFTYIRS